MNKKFLLGASFALMLVAAIGVAHKANAVTTAGNMEATILQAITLTAVDTLDFGNISPSGVAGTVTIDTAGARTSGGGVTLVGGGGENNGTFNLDGTDGVVVTVDVPAADQVDSGANNMVVDNFAYQYNGGAIVAGDGTATLAVGGPHIISIGARLNVGISQAAGTYTGTYDVTVLYQ